MGEPPVFYLVSGGTGAGKSTHARALAARAAAVRFSLDDWMATLFGPDVHEPLQLAWALERVERCEQRILATATDLAAVGTSSVLDLGFATRAQRSRWAGAARAAGARVELLVLSVAADERWCRVEQRDADQGSTDALHVSRAAFDHFEGVWEEPTDSEVASSGGVRLGSPAQG